MTNYEETISSKFESIRCDGPGIYPSLLEIIDNSIDWGKSTHIDITYDKLRGILIFSDNSPHGFKNEESIHRFFTLGKRNENVDGQTIGKFGKGGYQANINIADKLTIITHFDGKSHHIGTDFIEMEETNTSRPTISYQKNENNKHKKGSIFTLHLRANYKNQFNGDHLIRNIKRAYHNHDCICSCCKLI